MNTSDLVISNHAVRRWRERTGAKYSDDRVKSKMLALLAVAQRAELNPVNSVKALLNHDLEEADYYMASNFVFVIVGNTIKTVHGNESGRWSPAKILSDAEICVCPADSLEVLNITTKVQVRCKLCKRIRNL
jgi:hypothetical protein